MVDQQSSRITMFARGGGEKGRSKLLCSGKEEGRDGSGNNAFYLRTRGGRKAYSRGRKQEEGHEWRAKTPFHKKWTQGKKRGVLPSRTEGRKGEERKGFQ